jgi:hypothetical protein
MTSKSGLALTHSIRQQFVHESGAHYTRDHRALIDNAGSFSTPVSADQAEQHAGHIMCALRHSRSYS